MNTNNPTSSLAKIREQIAQRNNAKPDAPRCPHCGHSLTIDITDFFESKICENCFEYAEVNRIEESCCRTPAFHLVKVVVAGGGIQVRDQCTHCGCLKGGAVKVSPQDRDKLPLADLALKERRYDKKWNLFREANARINEAQSAKRKADWMAGYTQYLNSPEWREKRELVLKRDKYLCQCCLDALATQVHHKSYQFVDLAGSEPAFDLVAVCTPCHEKIEQMKRDARNPNNL